MVQIQVMIFDESIWFTRYKKVALSRREAVKICTYLKSLISLKIINKFLI